MVIWKLYILTGYRRTVINVVIIHMTCEINLGIVSSLVINLKNTDLIANVYTMDTLTSVISFLKSFIVVDLFKCSFYSECFLFCFVLFFLLLSFFFFLLRGAVGLVKQDIWIRFL